VRGVCDELRGGAMDGWFGSRLAQNFKLLALNFELASGSCSEDDCSPMRRTWDAFRRRSTPLWGYPLILSIS